MFFVDLSRTSHILPAGNKKATPKRVHEKGLSVHLELNRTGSVQVSHPSPFEKVGDKGEPFQILDTKQAVALLGWIFTLFKSAHKELNLDQRIKSPLLYRVELWAVAVVLYHIQR